MVDIELESVRWHSEFSPTVRRGRNLSDHSYCGSIRIRTEMNSPHYGVSLFDDPELRREYSCPVEMFHVKHLHKLVHSNSLSIPKST